jgi:hypothetical protein
MFPAVTVDADGRQQHRVLLDVDAVDLDDQKAQLGQIGGHPFRHLRLRQRHEPARHRRLGHTRALGRRNVTPRQADGAAELAGRDVDEHQVELTCSPSLSQL